LYLTSMVSNINLLAPHHSLLSDYDQRICFERGLKSYSTKLWRSLKSFTATSLEASYEKAILLETTMVEDNVLVSSDDSSDYSDDDTTVNSVRPQQHTSSRQPRRDNSSRDTRNTHNTHHRDNNHRDNNHKDNNHREHKQHRTQPYSNSKGSSGKSSRKLPSKRETYNLKCWHCRKTHKDGNCSICHKCGEDYHINCRATERKQLKHSRLIQKRRTASSCKNHNSWGHDGETCQAPCLLKSHHRDTKFKDCSCRNKRLN
jgi:hypothetical protein